MMRRIDNDNFFCLTLIHNSDFIFNLSSLVLRFGQVNFQLTSLFEFFNICET